MELVESKIVEITDMGDGSRAELDFIDILNEDEGVLVGNTGAGYILVLAETRSTDTYPPRPFRVNVGSIHQYVYVGNDVTRYVSEIKPGDKILVTNGISERMIAVGRVKIERRPIKRVVLDNSISASLQNADSIFVKEKNTAAHFIELQCESSIASFLSGNVARHKGEAVDEFIIEK
jgi:3-dehydroquinate synthase class II